MDTGAALKTLRAASTGAFAKGRCSSQPVARPGFAANSPSVLCIFAPAAVHAAWLAAATRVLARGIPEGCAACTTQTAGLWSQLGLTNGGEKPLSSIFAFASSATGTGFPSLCGGLHRSSSLDLWDSQRLQGCGSPPSRSLANARNARRSMNAVGGVEIPAKSRISCGDTIMSSLASALSNMAFNSVKDRNLSSFASPLSNKAFKLSSACAATSNQSRVSMSAYEYPSSSMRSFVDCGT